MEYNITDVRNEKMERTINSHIQIPRFILKNFANQQGTLFQLDAKTMQINRGFAKSINTKKGYFSNEVEEMMQHCFETPFSILLNWVRKHEFASVNSDISKESWKIVKSFVLLTMARTPKMYENIVANTVYTRFAAVNEEEKADLAVQICMEIEETVLDTFTITFFYNTSSIPFVLPLCGIYSAPFSRFSSLIYPVAPDLAIMLVKGDFAQELVEGNRTKLTVLNDEKLARKLNCRALYDQAHFDVYNRLDNNKLIGSSREVLEMLIDDYSEFMAFDKKKTEETS